MSAASAKPVPVEDDPLVDIQDTLAHYYNTKTRIPRSVLFGLIEATNKVRKIVPPAAERTAATKDIRDELESTYRLLMDDADFIDEQHPALAISIKGGCDSIKKCIDALNAKERAGTKA